MKVKLPEKKKSAKSSTGSESEEADDMSRKSMTKSDGISRPKVEKSTFTTYIYRVKKQVHPDLNISKSSMKVIESFINDFFNRISKEASTLMTSAGNKILREQDVLEAIRLVLPGELGKHAIGEAEKAIRIYDAATMTPS